MMERDMREREMRDRERERERDLLERRVGCVNTPVGTGTIPGPIGMPVGTCPGG